MATMHFGIVSVIGLSRLPTPAASRKAFSPAFRTTPRARIRAFASASTPSRPSMPLSQAAYAATESAGVRRGCQPSARRALMSE